MAAELEKRRAMEIRPKKEPGINKWLSQVVDLGPINKAAEAQVIGAEARVIGAEARVIPDGESRVIGVG